MLDVPPSDALVDDKPWIVVSPDGHRVSVQHDHFWNGGTLATAGDLVFQGTAEGWFNAYRATTGERLWRFDAGLGIMAAPMSYSVGGKQYVAVLDF